MLVFEVDFQFEPNLDTPSRNSLLEDWIKNAIEENSLQFGGGGGENEWKGVIEHISEDATEEHQHLIETWLKNNKLIISYNIGNLIEGN